MWESAKHHLDLVEKRLNVHITKLNIEDELRDGFKKWGFPSFHIRWCTGIKRETMKKYLKEKYGDEDIVQYIGYCADEEKRTSKKLYSSYDTEYPLVDFGITTKEALNICEEHGFTFGGVYDHHKHFNCWCCPLQRVSELEYIYIYEKDKWNYLRKLQDNTDGYYQNGKTIYQYEHKFWENKCKQLKQQRLDARRKTEIE